MRNSDPNGQPGGETRAERSTRISEIVSDPAVGGNILRHVGALEILLNGHATGGRRGAEPAVVGCLEQDESEHAMMIATASIMSIDHVVLFFAHDDPTGPPVRIDVIRNVGCHMEADRGCGLWSPADGGRAILTSRHSDSPRYFRSIPKRGLVTHHGMPSIAIEAGCRRAGARFAQLAASSEVAAGVGDGARFDLRSAGNVNLDIEMSRAAR